MCDSCIIQLNVAYNLKKNAIQSDMKLRQYMIEYGIGVTSYTTCSINTVSVIHPTPMIMSAPSDPNIGSCSTAPKSISTATEQRPFPVLPFIIKEEPIDYEVMSDISIQTGSFDDHLQCNRNGRTSINVSRNNNNQQQQSLTPLPSNSMVAVNTKSLMLSTREASDNEYLSAYIPAPSSDSSQSTTTTSSNSSTDKNMKTVSVTIETSSKATTEQSNDANKQTKMGMAKEQTINSKNNKTKDPQKHDIAERITRQNMKMGPDGKKLRESRTRGGSIAKKNYTNFFFSMRSSTPIDMEKKAKDNKRGHASMDASNIRTTSAKVSNAQKQRTFSPKTATKKRKLDLKKRSSL